MRQHHYEKTSMLRCLEVEFLSLSMSCVAVSSICAAPFSNMCSTQADNNSRKFWLRCSCKFLWCALPLGSCSSVNRPSLLANLLTFTVCSRMVGFVSMKPCATWGKIWSFTVAACRCPATEHLGCDKCIQSTVKLTFKDSLGRSGTEQ
jgi:hypothetical protein